jgi:D-alanyl-lipoteichoic acid acyltransferase DltB (MBOAT superfamily)
MTFIQLEFVAFLAISVALFYICPVKHRWKMLLAISIVFYAIAGVKYLPFIFVTSFSVFLAGRKIGRIYENLNEELENDKTLDRKAKKAKKDAAKQYAKKFLIACLVFNLALLCISKYTKFLVNPINDFLQMLGSGATFSAAMIIVPLGISYYTFSTLSYLLDVFWKKVDYETNYARFLLYAIYFPHILQGPIERYGRLGQRLKQEMRFDYHRCAYGLQLMLWGYFKKLVIADRLNIFIQSVYGVEQGMNGGFVYIIAGLLDVVYIYSDFSGCMDIARGASDLFGVELDLNFNHPFCSKSVVELWRRWHMSLGSWFKDYVYYPVSTSKLVKNLNKKARASKIPPRVSRVLITAIPVSITWILTGTWHGNGLGYVCWGVYYAFMILMSVSFGEDLTRFGEKLHINYNTLSWRFIQAARTTLIFAGGRLLTSPGSLSNTWYICKNILITFNPWIFFDGTLLKFGLDLLNVCVVIAAILVFFVVSQLQMRGSVRDMISRQNLVVRWMIYFAAMAVITIFGIYGPGYDASSFVYMAF